MLRKSRRTSASSDERATHSISSDSSTSSVMPKLDVNLSRRGATFSSTATTSISATKMLLLSMLVIVICGATSLVYAERDFNFNDSQVPLLEPKDEPQRARYVNQEHPYIAELSRCRYADSEILLSLVLKNQDWHELSENKREKVLDKLSKFFAIPKEFIIMETVTKREMNEMQKLSIRKGHNKCHNNRRLGRVNFMIGCGTKLFSMGEPIANQIGAQMKDGSIDNITGEKFGWWIIWRQDEKLRAQRNRRQIDGSGDDFEDDDYDYEDDTDDTAEPATEIPAVTSHAHRHHHGSAKTELNENELEVATNNNNNNPYNLNNNINNNNNKQRRPDYIPRKPEKIPVVIFNENSNENIKVPIKKIATSTSNNVADTESNFLQLSNKNGIIDEEIEKSVSQLESVISKTIENTKNIKELPVVETDVRPEDDEVVIDGVNEADNDDDDDDDDDDNDDVDDDNNTKNNNNNAVGSASVVTELEKALEKIEKVENDNINNELTTNAGSAHAITTIINEPIATTTTATASKTLNLNEALESIVVPLNQQHKQHQHQHHQQQHEHEHQHHNHHNTNNPNAAINNLNAAVIGREDKEEADVEQIDLNAVAEVINNAANTAVTYSTDNTANKIANTADNTATAIDTGTESDTVNALNAVNSVALPTAHPHGVTTTTTTPTAISGIIANNMQSVSSSTSVFNYLENSSSLSPTTLSSSSSSSTSSPLAFDVHGALSPSSSSSSSSGSVFNNLNTPSSSSTSSLSSTSLSSSLSPYLLSSLPIPTTTVATIITTTPSSTIITTTPSSSLQTKDDEEGNNTAIPDNESQEVSHGAISTTPQPIDAYGYSPQSPTGSSSSSHAPSSTTTTTLHAPDTTSPSTDDVEVRAENSPPTIRNRLQKLAVTSGKAFSFTVPTDTFYDDEDRTNLRLELTDKDGHELKLTSWLQFDAERRMIYGLPLDDAVSKWQYRLSATDSGNASVVEIVEISVQQHRGVRSVNHEIQIAVKVNEKNVPNIDWQRKLLRAISATLNDPSPSYIVVREIRQTAQDPNSALLIYFNETLSTSECPETELNDIVKRLDANRLNDLVQPILGVKSITGQLIGSCQKPQLPPNKPNIYGAKNLAPMPRNQVDRVNATQGHLLIYKVPSDTFYDPNDNDELTLTLRTKDNKELNPRHWLQFDSKNQEFYGIPKSGDVGQEEYLLVAEDTGGLTATDALVVVVNHAPKKEFSVYFKAYLAIRHEQFTADLQRKFVERISQLFGDREQNYIQIRSVNTHHDADGTIVNFYNTTLFKNGHRCPEEEMEAVRSVYLMQDNSLRDRVKKELGPELNLTSMSVISLGSCHYQPIDPNAPYVPPKTDHHPPTLKSSFADDYLYTFILPALIIVTMILVAALIACCLHRRRRKSGKMELGDEEERKSFRKGIPVIFQDELDEKPEIGNKSPIILKDEKPPLLPPSYNTSNMNGDNDVDEYVPPPAVVVGGREARGKSPATPSYRKPPPYVSP